MMLFLSSVRFKCKSFFQKLLQTTPLYNLLLWGRSPECSLVTHTDPWPGDITKGAALLEGHFILGSQVVSFNQLWFSQTLGPQQMLYLHSFEWLRDLRTIGDNASRRLARQLMSHWILHNHNWKTESWNPDVLGKRLFNWLALYDFFGASAGNDFHSKFFKSLIRQVNHLRRMSSLSQDLCEKHCILKGLLFAAGMIAKERTHFTRYLNQEISCLQAQIDDQGCHISRIPEVQLQILKDLIDIKSLLRNMAVEFPLALQKIIEKITPPLRLFRHGDGGLALFGAPAFQTPSADIDMALSLSDVKGRLSSTQATMGFMRLHAKSGLLLVNVGSPQKSLMKDGLAYLNFEWSMAKERIVVQSDFLFGSINPLFEGIQPRWEYHNQDEHQLLEATCATEGLVHKRQLYVPPLMTDMRGTEEISSQHVGLMKVRFLLHPHIKAAAIRGGQGAILKTTSGRSWRFFASGAIDIVCEDVAYQGPLYAQGLAIVLSFPLSAKTPTKIKWAFRIV